MADLKYSVEIDTKSAQQSLAGLQGTIAAFGSAVAGALALKQLNNVAANFQNLRTSLQILYKDAQLGNRVFEDIQKFAASSVFSVNDLTQTVIKLRAAGLDPTIAQLQLFADVSSVAADSVGALQAITDLYARTTAGGLGLEDLNRLADRGIPVFTILQEKLGLSRLEISKIGQSAEGAQIILKALETGLAETFGGASAARMGTVSQAMSNLSDTWQQFLDMIGRAGYNEGLSNLAKAFTNLLEQAKPVAAGIGYAIGGALEFVASNIKIVAVATGAWFAIMSVAAIAKIAQAFMLLGTVISKNPIVKFVQVLAGIATGMGIVLAGSEDLTQEMDKLNAKLNENTGGALANGKIGANVDELKGKLGGLNDGLRAFKAEMEGSLATFQKFNDETIKNINLESQLLGQSKVYQDIEKARNDLTKRSSDEIARLTEAKAKLTIEQQKEGRGEIIDAQIAKIQQITDIDIKRTEIAIRNANLREQAEQVRLFGISQQVDMEKQLNTVYDDIAKQGLSAIEQKYYDITAAANASALAAIRAEESRRGEAMPIAEQQKYYSLAQRGTDKLRAAQKQLYEQSRTFSAGWKKAFNEYADNATNAARQAERIFSKFTQGLEDLIVNFAKTGKFEWKSFVESMAEELLRSQVQQLIASVMGGFGGLFGTSGGGTGQGQGGSPQDPLYVYDIAGGGSGGANQIANMMAGKTGGGSSLFGSIADTIGGLFGNNVLSNTAPSNWYEKTQTPNFYEPWKNQSSGGFFSSIGDAISGAGSWLNQNLFGGFFANGGTLGAGRWGIAGENGPEIISGPAQVTPMGGTTNVTYNINAVDAPSFQALVARDPSFIHAVAMQGARGIPMGGR